VTEDLGPPPSSPPPFERAVAGEVLASVERLPGLVHVLAGPRQVRKTTAARAVAARWPGPGRFAAADELGPTTAGWLSAQREMGRRDAAAGAALLVLEPRPGSTPSSPGPRVRTR